MRDSAAANLLKWVALIYLGVGCQRVALAVSAGVPLRASEIAKPADIAGVASAALSLAANSPQPEPVKIAQADDGATASDAATMQETLNVMRQPSVKQRRRKPRMAGVPSGLQALELPPEEGVSTPPAAKVDVSPAALAVAQETPATGKAESQQALTGDAEGVLDAEGVDAPGAVALRKAAKMQLGLSSRKYRIAPIKWGGTITETVGFNHLTAFASPGGTLLSPYAAAASDTQTIYHIQSVKVGAETYVVQPWIAMVRGRLGVMSGTQGNQFNASDRKNTVFGGGDLALFNRSRFPFTMQYDVTDNRDNLANPESADTSNIASKKLRMNQLYRHPDEITNYELTYENDHSVDHYLGSNLNPGRAASIFSSALTTADSRLYGTYNTKLGSQQDQPFFLNANHNIGDTSITMQGRPAKGQSRRSDMLYARHIYMPEESLLTLSSYGSLFSSSLTATGQKDSGSHYLQAATNAVWQPESENIPLIVRGGVQLFKGQNDNVGIVNKTQSLSANTLLTYNAWADRRLSGGGTVAVTKVDGVQSASTTQFGRLDYYLRTVRLGRANYTRSFNAGFLHQTSTVTASDWNVYSGASHSLSAPYSFSLYGYHSNITPTAGQSLYINADQLNGSSATLSHNVAVIWRPNLTKKFPVSRSQNGEIRESAGEDANLHGIFGLRGYDTRVFGKNPSHTNTMVLSAGLGGLGAYRAQASGYGASGDLTLQAVFEGGQKSLNATGNARWGTQYSYNYNYRIDRPKFLGVKGLNYFLNLNAKANTNVLAQRSEVAASGAGSAGATGTHYGVGYGFALNQGLRYRIGQNEALLTASLADNYGIRTASLFLQFKAWRNFGN